VHIQDTVGVDIEGHLDLGNTTRGWGDTRKVKATQQVIVLGHSTLTFIDLDKHNRLVVSISSEGLSLLGGDSCVTGDEHSHDTTCSLDTLAKRCNIKKEKVLNLFGAFS